MRPHQGEPRLLSDDRVALSLAFLEGDAILTRRMLPGCTFLERIVVSLSCTSEQVRFILTCKSDGLAWASPEGICIHGQRRKVRPRA